MSPPITEQARNVVSVATSDEARDLDSQRASLFLELSPPFPLRRRMSHHGTRRSGVFPYIAAPTAAIGLSCCGPTRNRLQAIDATPAECAADKWGFFAGRSGPPLTSRCSIRKPHSNGLGLTRPDRAG